MITRVIIPAMLALALLALGACADSSTDSRAEDGTESDAEDGAEGGAEDGTENDAEDGAEGSSEVASRHGGVAVSVDLPEGWAEAGEDLARMVPEAATMYVNEDACAGEFCTNLNAMVIPTQAANLDEFHEATRQEVTQQLGGEIVREERVEVDSRGGHELEYTGQMMQRDLRFLQRYTLAGDKAVVVTFTGAADTFEEWRADAEAMLGSVIVEEEG